MVAKYALIPIELFDEEMLIGVTYPVCIDYGQWKMLEYNDQPDPKGEGWVIFSGDNANIECGNYVSSNLITSDPLSRQSIIDQLTTAAESSGLSVPFESFYYKYRNEIFNWISNGGDVLIKIFTNDTSEWLDMREDESKLSPREFALGLLIPTTEKDGLNKILVDETDVVETSTWQKIKNWFKF